MPVGGAEYRRLWALVVQAGDAREQILQQTQDEEEQEQKEAEEEDAGTVRSEEEQGGLWSGGYCCRTCHTMAMVGGR
jgi:hypothetical protein